MKHPSNKFRPRSCKLVCIGYLRNIHQKTGCYEYSTFQASYSLGLWNRCHKDIVVVTISDEALKPEALSYKALSSSLAKLKE